MKLNSAPAVTKQTELSNSGSLQGVVRRVVAINSWAGRRTYAVEVVGETKTRYRVKAIHFMILPGRRCVAAGQVVLVPKHAVLAEEPTECGAYAGGIYGYAPNK